MSVRARRLLQSSACAALIAAAICGQAVAQERTFNFNIPSESLSKALRDFGQATHEQLVFTEDLTAGKSAPELHGAYSASGGLARLLEGSGLVAERAPSGALIIRAEKASQALAQAPAAVSEIIVTANKREESISNVGEGISAVTSDQLQKLNANTVEDYLSFVPGVAFTSFGRPGQNQITIRGIAALGLGSAISTYVDEIPVGSASNEAQGSSYTPDIDPADLDHVEVLKGPQGTLYGASSLGGVLKYVTKAPSLTDTELEAGAEVNNVDHGDTGYKLRLAGTTPIVKDVLGIRASAYYRSDAGYIDNGLTGANNINSDTSYGGRIAALWAPTDKLQVKLGVVLQKTDAKGLDAVSYNASPSFPPPFVLSHGDLDQYLHRSQPNSVTDQIYSGEIHYDLGWANFVSATGVSREDIFRNTDTTGTYTRPSYFNALHEPVGSTSQLINNYNIKKWSEEARLQSASNGKLEWVVGAIYQKETSYTDGFVTIMGPDGALLPQPAGKASFSFANNSLEEYAGFGDITWYVVPDFDLSAGYRRSHISQSNSILQYGYVFEPATPTAPITRLDTPVNDVDTYSFGARWRVTSDVMLYARAASGFRPGGGRGQPPVVVPNFVFSYNPDTDWSYETGVKAKFWGGKAALDVDGFWIDWKNTQTLVPALVGQPFLINGNGGDAVSRGFEGELALNPIEGLNIIANMASTDAHFTQTVPGSSVAGGELEFVARFTASLQVDYERPLANGWNGFVGGDYRFRSSMLDALDARMPKYDQVDLHLGVEKNGLRLSAFATNLGDTRGLLGYTGGGNQPGDPFRYAVTQPRTIGLSVTQKW